MYPGFQFTPTQDFFSDDFKSQYCAGLTYTVRDQKLADATKKWLDEKLIVPVMDAVGAKIRGE